MALAVNDSGTKVIRVSLVLAVRVMIAQPPQKVRAVRVVMTQAIPVAEGEAMMTMLAVAVTEMAVLAVAVTEMAMLAVTEMEMLAVQPPQLPDLPVLELVADVNAPILPNPL